MKEEEINRCQIQEWYPKFKSVSIKTIIHELPTPFIDYLLNDSQPFILPLSISNDDALPNRIHNPYEQEDFVVSENDDDGSDDEEIIAPSFPELETEIIASIEKLGGVVFPKLNWSAPKDSAWISPTGNLKCSNFLDIVLLFRSSDSLVNDLCHAYDSCEDTSLTRPSSFYLALRKWYELRCEMEFRCFVRGGRLVGICQREVSSFYDVVLEKRLELERLISEFFVGEVEGRFESESYVFDVYVTGDDRVKVVDFNPWGGFTLPLLFTWEELEGMDGVEFRIVESQCGIRPGLKTAVPYDYLDTSSGSGWDQFMKNADEELKRQSSFSEAGA